MNENRDVTLETNRILLHTIRSCDNSIKHLNNLINVSELFDEDEAFKLVKTESIKRIKFLEHKKTVCNKLGMEIKNLKTAKNININALCVCAKALVGYDPFMELEELLERKTTKHE